MTQRIYRNSDTTDAISGAELLTLLEHHRSPSFCSGVRIVTPSLEFCVGFRWLPLWYLQSNISFQYQYQHVFIYFILMTYGQQETAALTFFSVFFSLFNSSYFHFPCSLSWMSDLLATITHSIWRFFSLDLYTNKQYRYET